MGALFFDPEMSFSRPRDWSILFSAAACLFFDLQLFFSPAMRPRKRAQSFFQPLCKILSSLFLGPETSCSEPRIFFRTPRHLFLDLRCFFDLCRRDAHTRRDEKEIANQELGKLGNKSQARENKGTKLHATDSKNEKTFFTHNKEKATRKALHGVGSDESRLKEPHARNNKNKHHNEKKATRNRVRGLKTMKRN